MPPSSASRITAFSFMALPGSRVIVGPAPAATPLPFRFAVPPVGGLADETHNTHAAKPFRWTKSAHAILDAVSRPRNVTLARLCDLPGFGPTPAAILFPIRGAAFQKVTQLLSCRDDLSGVMQGRVLLRIKVARRLAGVLVHDPRIARVFRLQPLADAARHAADDISHCAVRAADSFTIETVQNQM